MILRKYDSENNNDGSTCELYAIWDTEMKLDSNFYINVMRNSVEEMTNQTKLVIKELLFEYDIIHVTDIDVHFGNCTFKVVLLQFTGNRNCNVTFYNCTMGTTDLATPILFKFNICHHIFFKICKI